jgi:hypothetical protein
VLANGSIDVSLQRQTVLEGLTLMAGRHHFSEL